MRDKIKISRVQIKCLIAPAHLTVTGPSPDRRQIGTHTECDSHAYFVSHHSLAHRQAVRNWKCSIGIVNFTPFLYRFFE